MKKKVLGVSGGVVCTSISPMPKQGLLDVAVLVLRLGRLHFLLGGFLLFSMGFLFAVSGTFDLLRYGLGYSILFTAQLSVSYSNDYFDRDVDVLGTQTPVSGGSGVLVEHPGLIPLSKRLALFLIFCSLLLSVLYLIRFSGGIGLFAVVVFGNALGWYYTAPPLRLAYTGWGEIANVAAFGFLIPGWGYHISSGGLDAGFIVLAMPLMLYGIYFILSVQLPDLEGDRMGNKWNFIARKGRKIGMETIVIASFLATLLIVMLSLFIPKDVLGPSTDFFLPFMALFSIIPLASSFHGILYTPLGKDAASRYATRNIVALMLFGAAANTVLLFHFYA